MAQEKIRQTERIYVDVNSDFDKTGYMRPKSIIWSDGREFRIDSIRDMRPASFGLEDDCYTVVIKGEEKHLFFERTNGMFRSRVGRWYVRALTAQ